MPRSLQTILTFAKLDTRRFFRDRMAIFFGILFPLIFLFVFGGIFNNDSSISFNVALVNQSNTQVVKDFSAQLKKDKVFKVDKNITTYDGARQKMSRNQLDATIVSPKTFGEVKNGVPTGQAEVYFTQNNATAGQQLAAGLQSVFDEGINAKLVNVQKPFTSEAKELNEKSLRQFDYTFAGLLGFAIIGMGIFGPVNVFPELKKQGILRRLHTTTLKTWQYFVSTALSQVAIGLVSIGIMFAVAISVFHLKVAGNYPELILFVMASIVMILGIGLAIGGWAQNERQAAPLSNIVVFPMMFLSGTFFPRFLMPEWLQHVSGFLPLTPVIDGIRLIVTEGKHLTDLGPQLGLIGIWLVVIYLLAFRFFRWE